MRLITALLLLLITALLLLLPAGALANEHLQVLGDIDQDGDADFAVAARYGDVIITDAQGMNKSGISLYADGNRCENPDFQASNRSTLAVLPDRNGNGSNELRIEGAVPYDHPDESPAFCDIKFYAALETWDPLTLSLLAGQVTYADGGPKDAIRNYTPVWDQTGDGVGDMIGENDFFVRATLHDGTDLFSVLSYFGPRGYSFGWAAAGPEGVAILRDQSVDKSDFIEFWDPAADRKTRTIWIGKGYSRTGSPAPRLLALGNVGGTSDKDWAVLQSTGDGEDTRYSVGVFDGRWGHTIRRVPFTGWAIPYHLMLLNGGTDLALVSRFFGSGAQPVEVRDVKTGAQKFRVWIPKTLHFEGITRTPDMNANGGNDIAVSGIQWGMLVLMIFDGKTGERIRRLVL
jgi:hypothetical protein